MGGPPTTSPSADRRGGRQIALLAGRLNPDAANLAEPSWVPWHAAAAKEKSGLPDPYSLDVDPEDLLAYEVDTTLEEVTVVARSGSVKAKRAFSAVDAHLRLNREELRVRAV